MKDFSVGNEVVHLITKLYFLIFQVPTDVFIEIPKY